MSCRVTVSCYRDPGPRGRVRWWEWERGQLGGSTSDADPWRAKAEHMKIKKEKAAFVTPKLQ